MTNAHAVLFGLVVVAASILVSNIAAPVSAQPAPTIIPPVEALVATGEATGPNGPWHLWRMNRHTGQLSFCTATSPPGRTDKPSETVIECSSTSPPM